MNNAQLITHIEKFVFAQITPPRFHIELSQKVGLALAKKHHANETVIIFGTLLMDCMLGKAIEDNRIHEHVEMSIAKAKEFLDQASELKEEEKENILFCVEQHHGNVKFKSIEAEICCNADCYRFASVKGVVGGIKYSRDMEISELVSLYLSKADEKINAVTLPECKEELQLQYEFIKNFLKGYLL